MQEQHQTDRPPRESRRLSRFFLLSFGYVGFRFLLSPLRTRLLTELLSKELYGSLTLAVMTITFIATFSSLGGYEFLVRRMPGLPLDRQKGWLRLLLTRLALPGWIAAGLLTALAKQIGWLPALTIPDLALLWSGLGLTSWLLYRVFFSLGIGDLVRVRSIQVFQNDLWFIAIVAAGSWAAASFTHSLIVWTGWLACTAVAVKWWARLPGVATKPSETLGDVIRFGAPLLPMISGEILFRLADRYILLGYFDIQTVAEYTLSMNVAMMVYVMGASMLDLTVPVFYAARNEKTGGDGAGPTDEMRRLFSVMMRHVWGIGLSAGIALCFFYKDLFYIVSGPAFRDAAYLLPWMAFIPLAFLLVTVVSRALLAQDRSRLVGGATLAAALLNMVLNFLLAPRWGAIGAALATLFSMVGLAVILGWALRCRAWLNRSDLRPFSLAVTALICASGFALLRWGMPDLNAWLRLAAAGIVTALSLLGGGVFSPRDISFIRSAPSAEEDESVGQ